MDRAFLVGSFVLPKQTDGSLRLESPRNAASATLPTSATARRRQVEATPHGRGVGHDIVHILLSRQLQLPGSGGNRPPRAPWPCLGLGFSLKLRQFTPNPTLQVRCRTGFASPPRSGATPLSIAIKKGNADAKRKYVDKSKARIQPPSPEPFPIASGVA